MALKVLGIMGSPRLGGNTDLLLDRALAGAASQGAEVEKVAVCELKISPCTSCGDCLTTGECTIDDDMEQVYRKLRRTDRLILASPIFFLSITAQTKAMIDRCQSLWVTKYRLQRPVSLGATPRRGLFISVANMDRPREFQPAIAVVKAFFAVLDVAYANELLVGGIEDKGEIARHPEALERAFAAGSNLVAPG